MGNTPIQAQSADSISDDANYRTLEYNLTDLDYPIDSIRSSSNDEHLSDADVRHLFGSIRRSLLDTLWEHKQLELHIFRRERMGNGYAWDMSEADDRAAAGSNRYAFYREQDDRLEMESGARSLVVDMIVQHVDSYRQAVDNVKALQRKKTFMVPDGKA